MATSSTSARRRLIVLCLFLVATARSEEIAVPNGSIDVQFTATPSPKLDAVTQTWVKNALTAVSTYYGGAFPAKGGVLRITPVDGNDVGDGHAFGWNGPLITISLGRNATNESLHDDWMLTHEMLHLCFPNLAKNHHWLEEGLATYVEPIARARAGLLTPSRVWGDLVRDLHQGLPEPGDQGLDNTHTWGRTYWGGALFCLRADVEIRKRTGNRKGLEDALRAIAAKGGTIEHSWKIDQVIATGDGATGVPVLRELYDEMKDKPVDVDLAALWKQLGVLHQGKTVTFDDTAPLAPIRKAITGG